MNPVSLFGLARSRVFGGAIAVLMILALIGGTMQPPAAQAQNVDWLSAESASYLTSSGIVVYVPSWLPGGVAGTTPEIYAGGGSYSIYFYAPAGFLYITGVAGAGFPGGSEANLNVELAVNSSVMGYPAINDVGIPEGSETPIYDKTMWIADGVLYTVSLLGVGVDSGSLANSSVALTAPAAPPAPQEPADPQPAPTDPPVAQPEPSTDAPANTDNQPAPADNGNDTGSDDVSQRNVSQQGDTANPETGRESLRQPTAPADDGTGGAWYVGFQVDGVSDGTDGAPPPILGDGTGGAD